MPKSDVYFSISRSEIVPKFDYTFTSNGTSFTNYNLTIAQFAIQWNPFSDYMQTNSNRIEINKNTLNLVFNLHIQ